MTTEYANRPHVNGDYKLVERPNNRVSIRRAIGGEWYVLGTIDPMTRAEAIKWLREREAEHIEQFETARMRAHQCGALARSLSVARFFDRFGTLGDDRTCSPSKAIDLAGQPFVSNGHWMIYVSQEEYDGFQARVIDIDPSKSTPNPGGWPPYSAMDPDLWVEVPNLDDPKQAEATHADSEGRIEIGGVLINRQYVQLLNCLGVTKVQTRNDGRSDVMVLVPEVVAVMGCRRTPMRGVELLRDALDVPQ